MTAKYDAKTISNALEEHIRLDCHFDDTQTKQLICLIDSISGQLAQAPTSNIDINAASYSKFVSTLYNCANCDDTLKPSTKRSILYAIGELQKSLWRH